MSSEKKVINILTIIITLFIYSYPISIEPKKYSNLEMLYEDPLVFETWEFTREFYKRSEYIENDKEICNFLSSNWKYEDHHIFIEYIFATKNYLTRKINLYKIILLHDETKFKSYKHDIEGAWVVILFEKMKPDNALLINDETVGDLKELIEGYINKGEKYKLDKINEVLYFEKVNQIQESNMYICNVRLNLKNDKNDNNIDDIISEEFLVEEDIPSKRKTLRYIVHRNPNIKSC